MGRERQDQRGKMHPEWGGLLPGLLLVRETYGEKKLVLTHSLSAAGWGSFLVWAGLVTLVTATLWAIPSFVSNYMIIIQSVFLRGKKGKYIFLGTIINRYSLFLITPPKKNNNNEEVEGNELPVRIIF